MQSVEKLTSLLLLLKQSYKLNLPNILDASLILSMESEVKNKNQEKHFCFWFKHFPWIRRQKGVKKKKDFFFFFFSVSFLTQKL